MDELIEKTILAVGIPPSMHERARANLKRKTVDEIKAIHDKAIERRQRAKEWIEKHGRLQDNVDRR